MRLLLTAFCLLLILAPLHAQDRRRAFQAPAAGSSFPSGCIAYWKGDESSGNMADSIGSLTLANNGTAAFAAGKINNAPQFVSASSRYFSASDSAITSFGAGVYKSISFWIRATDTANFNSIASKRGGTAHEYTITFNGARKFTWLVYDPSANLTFYSAAAAWGDNETHFVTLGYDGANLTMSIDGVAETPQAYTADIRDSDSPWEVGAQASLGAYFDGWIDEIAFWDHALSAGDITILYNSGSGLQP